MVYLIDDTGSQKLIREQLRRIFLKLLAVHGTTADVRVAALVHGDIARVGSQKYHTGLFPHERNTLGRGNRGPHLLAPGFKEPKDISPQDVTDGINNLKLLAHREYLYPGIALAEHIITVECPAGSAKNWCKRKVIVILGDGNPGRGATDYFYPHSYSDLPEKLLYDVRIAEIELHTLCLGAACTNQIVRIPDGQKFYYDPKPPNCITEECTGYTGTDIMKELAKRSYNKGKFYQ